MSQNWLDKNNNKSQNNLSLGHIYNNQTLSFIHKKCEKISCAVYLVTNHLSDKEPVKWTVRKCSLALVKDIFKLRENYSSNFEAPSSIKVNLIGIISYLNLLNSAGFISNANFTIIEGEISNLASYFSSNYDLTSNQDSHFSKDFFGVEELKLPKEIEKDTSSHEYKGHYKGHIDKGHLSLINISQNTKDESQEKQNNNLSGAGRKQSILALIKSKKVVSIKDISSFIKDCSEKTLQRDLGAMVKAGVLKKEGERRWSKYLLA